MKRKVWRQFLLEVQRTIELWQRATKEFDYRLWHSCAGGFMYIKLTSATQVPLTDAQRNHVLIFFRVLARELGLNYNLKRSPAENIVEGVFEIPPSYSPRK